MCCPTSPRVTTFRMAVSSCWFVIMIFLHVWHGACVAVELQFSSEFTTPSTVVQDMRNANPDYVISPQVGGFRCPTHARRLRNGAYASTWIKQQDRRQRRFRFGAVCIVRIIVQWLCAYVQWWCGGSKCSSLLLDSNNTGPSTRRSASVLV